MTSRRERVLAHLADVVVHEGTVGDLAADLDDPSPNSVSAAVSLLIKDGTVKRYPDVPGVVARWLWLTENDASAQRVIAAASNEGAEPEQAARDSRVMSHESRLANAPEEQIDEVLAVEPSEFESDVREVTLDPAFGTIVDGLRRCPDGEPCGCVCEQMCARVLEGEKPVGADRWPLRVIDAHGLFGDEGTVGDEALINDRDDVRRAYAEDQAVGRITDVRETDRGIEVSGVALPDSALDQLLERIEKGYRSARDIRRELIGRPDPVLDVQIDVARRRILVDGRVLDREQTLSLIDDLTDALRAHEAL